MNENNKFIFMFSFHLFRYCLISGLIVFGSNTGFGSELNVNRANESPSLSKTDFTTWLRAGAAEFGCFLEKRFKYRDPKFNCSMEKFSPQSGPCKKTTDYYDGPKFPVDRVSEVSPSVSSIALKWEHGNLRELRAELKGEWDQAKVRKEFQLHQAPNVQQIRIQKTKKDKTIVHLEGFDHLGAGDLECKEEK